MSIKIIFAGTPEIACPALAALIADPNCDVVAVYTQPDRPSGRGRKLTASPVKALAQQHNLTIEQPENFKSDHALATLKNFAADVMVVMAYGLILPAAVIDAAKNDCINLHVSLLPKWRGAAPIARALWSGDSMTGVSLMRITAGLDQGPVFATASLEITADDTTGSLTAKLAQTAATLLIENIAAINAQSLTAEPQNDALASYASKLSKQEGLINWHKSATELHLQIRACNPWPMAFSYFAGTPVRIIKAHVDLESSSATPGTVIDISKRGIIVACAKHCIVISVLQLPGKKQMPVAACFAALKSWQGQCFTIQPG